jgi:hypothetical protein
MGDARVDVATVTAELRSNPRIVEAAAAELFTPEECAAIVAECDERGWRYVAPPEQGSAQRNKTEQLLPGGNRGWIGERIATCVSDINAEVYRFRLLGLEEPVRVFSNTVKRAGSSTSTST